MHCAGGTHLMPPHFAFSRQSREHVPAVHVALHVELSLQLKLQKFEAHCAVQLALSSHWMSHGPAAHAMVHFASRSHVIWQGGAVQRKSHVCPSPQLHWSPHSFVALVLESTPASAVGFPLDPPSTVAPLEPPLPELDDGAPPPMVQSYEHAPMTMPPTAMTDATEKRCTPLV